jgi:hypothetical protein
MLVWTPDAKYGDMIPIPLDRYLTCNRYGVNAGLDPKLETLKIVTHCSERKFGWQVPRFQG